MQAIVSGFVTVVTKSLDIYVHAALLNFCHLKSPIKSFYLAVSHLKMKF